MDLCSCWRFWPSSQWWGGVKLDDLRSLISGVRRRWFAAVVLRTIGIAAFVAALPVAAGAVAGWSFAPEGAALIALAAVSGLGAAAVGGAVLWRMPRRPSDLTTARFIEEQAAHLDLVRLDDRLVSAVQVSATRELQADPFAVAVVAQAAERLRALSPQAIVPPRTLRRSAVQAVAGVACLAVAILVALPSLGTAAD